MSTFNLWDWRTDLDSTYVLLFLKLHNEVDPSLSLSLNYSLFIYMVLNNICESCFYKLMNWTCKGFKLSWTSMFPLHPTECHITLALSIITKTGRHGKYKAGFCDTLYNNVNHSNSHLKPFFRSGTSFCYRTQPYQYFFVCLLHQNEKY